MEMEIFPAYAGVNLITGIVAGGVSNIPRIRGGEPKEVHFDSFNMEYSPHTRG